MSSSAMTPVACSRCGATARVQKHSWEHTSVEWADGAAAACEEITAGAAEGRMPGQVARCEAMDQTIREAVHAGDIPVGGADEVDLTGG